MYPEWVNRLEDLAGPGHTTGFSTAGGFLAPAFSGDQIESWKPPPEAGSAYWLTPSQIRLVIYLT